MSEAEDDYLSDKFLMEPSSSTPTTYAERRRQAERESRRKNEQNRKRSRKELEDASREEGLSKSLFHRAAEEEASLSRASGGTKAISMMLKMGFKPGQSLGLLDADSVKSISAEPPPSDHNLSELVPAAHFHTIQMTHRTEPIPIRIWSGKEGLGRKRRAVSPNTAAEGSLLSRAARDEFQARSRSTYEERRNLGRLIGAIKTCISLDEKIGIRFNYLWLNPQDPESFPEGLVDALEDPSQDLPLSRLLPSQPHESSLKEKMTAERLDTVTDLTAASAPPKFLTNPDLFSLSTIADVKRYCLLPISECLRELLDYLRRKHSYCFWCGTEYNDQDEMNKQCPGVDEDAHD